MSNPSSDKKLTPIVPLESVTRRIYFIRGQKVMIDVDLAELYGVLTMTLNQSVKRNATRFPEDFMFRLSKQEKDEVITNCDNLGKLKFSPHLPYAFTEHGVAMLSSVLRSPKAVQMNILIVRAFIKIREILASNKEIAQKIGELEREQKSQSKHINTIYRMIEKLIEEPEKPKNPIGFSVK